MNLAPKNAKDLAIYAGLIIGGYVVYQGFKFGGKVKKVVSEDLNPASDQNVVYKAAGGKNNTITLFDPLFKTFRDDTAPFGLNPFAIFKSKEERGLDDLGNPTADADINKNDVQTLPYDSNNVKLMPATTTHYEDSDSKKLIFGDNDPFSELVEPAIGENTVLQPRDGKAQSAQLVPLMDYGQKDAYYPSYTTKLTGG